MEGRTEQLKHLLARETNRERTKLSMERKPRSGERTVPVIYYLSRNGHLDHPHFMEITVPTGEGLHLRDVINRLNSLRGKGLGSMYSWSCKRVYKNGFVWHDLSQDDFIYSLQGNEYVLKGSEILDIDIYPRNTQGSNKDAHSEVSKSTRDDSDLLLDKRKKKTTLDMNENKVYKNDNPMKVREKWRQISRIPAIQEEPENHLVNEVPSPPFSSSLETVEAVIRAHSRIVPVGDNDKDRYVARGRIRPSMAIMHLLSCGSILTKLGCSRAHASKESLPRSLSSSLAEKESEELKEIVLSAIKVHGRDCTKKGSSDHAIGGFSQGLTRSYSCSAQR